MAIETATYVNDLNSANPGATDVAQQGDDHIRLIKAALKTTFPGRDHVDYLASVVAKTSNFSVDQDQRGYPVDATGGAVTAALPAFSSIYDGYEITVWKTDASANAVVLDGSGSEQIEGATTLSLGSQWAGVTLRADKTGTQWRIVARWGRVLAAYGITASFTETCDEPIYIAQPQAKTYRIVIDRKFAGTILEMTGRTESGSVTAQLQNAGVNVGSGLACTTAEASTTYSTGNTFAAGDDWTLVLSSITSALGLSLNIKYTRVISI